MRAQKQILFFLSVVILLRKGVLVKTCENPPQVSNSNIRIYHETDPDEIVIAHYTCETGYQLVGDDEIYCTSQSNQWHGDPPECKSQEKSKKDGGVKEKSQQRYQDVEEDSNITNEYASALDMTCLEDGLIRAPQIHNGEVVRYSRRKKGSKVFLVAFYECDHGFELENSLVDKLFCSQEQWVGDVPQCLGIDGDEVYEDGDETDVESYRGETENKHLDYEVETDYDERTNIQRVPCDDSDAENPCDQVCHIVQYPQESEPRVECSCHAGYQLDEYDGRTCTDKDECQHNNGGCQDICENNMGSFRCLCKSGYRLNVNNTCVALNISDVNISDVKFENAISFTDKDGSPVSEEDNEINRSDGNKPSENWKKDSEEQKKSDEISNEIEEYHKKNDLSEITIPPLDESTTAIHHQNWIEIDQVTKATTDDAISITTQHKSQDSREDEDDDYEAENEDNNENHGTDDHTENEDDDNEEDSEHLNLAHLDFHERNKHLEPSSTDNNTGENETNHDSKNKMCEDGLKLDQYGKCVDINECETMETGCELCVNLYQGYECTCLDGFELNEDEKSCDDINECVVYSEFEDDNGVVQLSKICEHECINTPGSYLCTCPPNHHLQSDNRSCVVDTCKDLFQLDKTTCSHFCDDSENGFVCSCPENMVLGQDGITCEEAADCNDDQKAFCVPGKCSIYENSYKCHCPTGFIESSNRCIDIDECVSANHGCSHQCQNMYGTYTCLCPIGLELGSDGKTCLDIDECAKGDSVCSGHPCVNTFGSFKCLRCDKGYRLDSVNQVCVDQDECRRNNGGCSHTCTNNIGSFQCSCPEHLELASDGKNCMDIDECSRNNGNCSNICINLIGSYHCACEAGYKLTDSTTCYDIDECEENIHECSHACHNLDGTYECSCPRGMQFKKPDTFTCHDINECETVPNGGCSDICINVESSYYCVCPAGYQLQSDGKTCHDINECESSPCSHECLNSPGSFSCLCPNGFHLSDNMQTCVDTDECQGEDNHCSQLCENFEGGFRCKCEQGYVLGVDGKTCHDRDECSTNNGGCEHVCVNIDGGHYCLCNKDHALRADNRSCETNDPCSFNNGGCDQVCTNVLGNAVCSCFLGYTINESNPTACDDVNECQIKDICAVNARCINTISGYKCECHSGFKMVDGQCLDVNECLVFNGGCSSNAKCVNTVGSHKCVCYAGLRLAKDMKTCIEIQDKCIPLKAPKHGEVRCSRSRHKTQLFYKTKCSFWCQKGFTLVGSSARNCNGSTWDGEDTQCIPQACPRLSSPEHGTIQPVHCMTSDVLLGERCILHCHQGFKPLGKRVAVCEINNSWSPSSELQCIPAVSVSLTKLRVKPRIRCPNDIHISLHPGNSSVIVNIPKPESNIDFAKYVDSQPSWAKKLRQELAPGVHSIQFRARSPDSHLNDVCNLKINITNTEPPKILFCPNSFEVHLKPQERFQQVFWKEPKFQASSRLKAVFKNRLPGSKLSAGIHETQYIATDIDGLETSCVFNITVKESIEQTSSYTLEAPRVEKFLLCPGKSAVRISTHFAHHKTPKRCIIQEKIKNTDSLHDNRGRSQNPPISPAATRRKFSQPRTNTNRQATAADLSAWESASGPNENHFQRQSNYF